MEWLEIHIGPLGPLAVGSTPSKSHSKPGAKKQQRTQNHDVKSCLKAAFSATTSALWTPNLHQSHSDFRHYFRPKLALWTPNLHQSPLWASDSSAFILVPLLFAESSGPRLRTGLRRLGARHRFFFFVFLFFSVRPSARKPGRRFEKSAHPSKILKAFGYRRQSDVEKGLEVSSQVVVYRWHAARSEISKQKCTLVTDVSLQPHLGQLVLEFLASHTRNVCLFPDFILKHTQ